MENNNPTVLVKRDYDHHTGITEEFWHQPGIGDRPGKITMRRLQDVQGQLDHNKAQFNNHGNVGYGDVTGGAFKVATIPFTIIEKWLREDGFNWYESTDKQRRMKLNSPENRYLLVRPGRL